MPRKPEDGAPRDESAKLDDEARKELFGRSELESAPEEPTSEGRERHSGGPSSGESRAGGSSHKQST